MITDHPLTYVRPILRNRRWVMKTIDDVTGEEAEYSYPTEAAALEVFMALVQARIDREEGN